MRTTAELLRAGLPGRLAFTESVTALYPFSVLPSNDALAPWAVATLTIPQRAICVCSDQSAADMICLALNLSARAVRAARGAA